MIAETVKPQNAETAKIASRKVMARPLDAELYVVSVDSGIKETEADRKALEANLRFAESLGAKIVRLKGRSVADAVADFVREKHITQVIFGRTAVKGLRKYLYLSAVYRFLREAPSVDVHIVTHEGA